MFLGRLISFLKKAKGDANILEKMKADNSSKDVADIAK